MINEITINKFKRIEEPITLQDLPRISVLFGLNGSGKSSVLEALFKALPRALDPSPVVDEGQRTPNTLGFLQEPEESLVNCDADRPTFVSLWRPTGGEGSAEVRAYGSDAITELGIAAPGMLMAHEPSLQADQISERAAFSSSGAFVARVSLFLREELDLRPPQTSDMSGAMWAFGHNYLTAMAWHFAESIRVVRNQMAQPWEKGLLFLADEPSNSLHPSAHSIVYGLFEMLLAYAEDNEVDCQVVATTHAPGLVGAICARGGAAYELARGRLVSSDTREPDVRSAGYRDAAGLVRAADLLSDQANRLLPETVVICEASLKAYIDERRREGPQPFAVIAAGGDSVNMQLAEALKKTIASSKALLDKSILSIKRLVVAIDQNPEIPDVQRNKVRAMDGVELHEFDFGDLESQYPAASIADFCEERGVPAPSTDEAVPAWVRRIKPAHREIKIELAIWMAANGVRVPAIEDLLDQLQIWAAAGPNEVEN